MSGDGLRVVDDETKGLIVDQTIEKVSFCAPDRNHERGFSYICRDGTTRRWMCHGFLANKDSGERLSHAVGCAFAVCLERKQRRDKECGVTMTFDMKNSTFTRTGSFRTQTLTERLLNSERGVDVVPGVLPSAAVAPTPKPYNPFAIERPHATESMLQRQGSFRAFNQLAASSPFKRQMSLRVNDLPSNAERQRAFLEPSKQNHRSVSPIPEVSPHQSETVNQLCQELSEGLSILTKNDVDDFNFNNQMSINQNTAAEMLNSANQSNELAVFNPQRSLLYNSSSNNTTEMSVISSIDSGTTHQQYQQKTTTVISSISGGTPTAQISPQRREIVTPTSPVKAIPDSPQKMFPIETVASLPNPDQWLGQVVNKNAPTPSPKRPPTLSVQSRTKSLNSSDPFDAEWAERLAKPDPTRSTNPFISPPKPPAQSFQVQL